VGARVTKKGRDPTARGRQGRHLGGARGGGGSGGRDGNARARREVGGPAMRGMRRGGGWGAWLGEGNVHRRVRGEGGERGHG
jgi:hypothetical protein